MPQDRSTRPLVLLVDDDARLVHVVTLYLHVQQIDVVSARDGEAAMNLLGDSIPDLAIVDVMMPGMGGIGLCRRIRTLPGGRDLPIIVFTALSDSRDLDAARAAGADMVITKPFSLPGLGAAVEALLPGRVEPAAAPAV